MPSCAGKNHFAEIFAATSQILEALNLVIFEKDRNLIHVIQGKIFC